MILLKRYGPFIIVLLLQACIFVIHDDKNTVHADTLTTTDSLKALSPNADSIGADSVKPDSLIAVIDTVKKTLHFYPIQL
jgi:hypothetical protein